MGAVLSHPPIWGLEIIPKLCTAFLSAPFDRVAISKQAQCGPSSSHKLVGMSLWRQLVRIVRNEGFTSLWRGCQCRYSALGISAFCSMIRHSVDRLLLQNHRTNPRNSNGRATRKSSVGRMLGSAFNMIVTVGLEILFTYPLQVIYEKMASEEPDKAGAYPHSSMSEVYHDIVDNNGIRGLYTGLQTTWYCYLGRSALGFLLFDYYTIKYSAGHMYLFKSVMKHLTSGIGSMVTYWAELIRYRLTGQLGAGTKEYTDFTNCFSRVCQNEGFLSLYKGYSFVVTQGLIVKLSSIYIHYLVLSKLYHTTGAENPQPRHQEGFSSSSDASSSGYEEEGSDESFSEDPDSLSSEEGEAR
mmetsp:Transcript_54309/g.62214  ORF Transcript_54309/g.62214 Transcript_54309/m.62214 type:complete len:355 (+) Transcript_54309:43-1107(+)